MSSLGARLACGRTSRLCTRAAVLFGLLNAALMLIVPSVKVNEQIKVKTAAAGGRCSAADLADMPKCVRKVQSSSIRNPPENGVDVCSLIRELAGCFPVCMCYTDEGREMMIDMQILAGSRCPLTCGDGSWLPDSSAASLILFGLFSLPFEGAAALASCSQSCSGLGLLAFLLRVSPTWARFLVCLIEATVLIVLQVHHQWSVTGWAFSAMCCVSCILYAIAVCDPSPEPTPAGEDGDRAAPAREMHALERDPELSGEAGATARASAPGAARPALEESKSTTVVSTRPPQMEEALRNGII
jgi:hypothetical protein